MAAHLQDVSSTIWVLASPSPKGKCSRTFPSSNSERSTRNFLSFPSSAAPHRRLSLIRGLYSVRLSATQKSEEKVVVDESFEGTDFHNRATSADPSSVLENWCIKFEQSMNIFIIDLSITILDALYHGRHYARFFVLETIARVPYFAYVFVLHFYESFGWSRKPDYMIVHFAESWNETHHLLIMEELGGNSWWFDRFLAQIISIFYFVMTVLMYILSPRAAYHLSECLERHAFVTYDLFIKARGDALKDLPAPEIAVRYYTEGDLYMFDEFQTARDPYSRRPKVENLYDVFVNIRDDEAEHCKTMQACQTDGSLHSPHSYQDTTFRVPRRR